ncbi:hypothetical protein Tco_1403752 [Tanacetum coccineum]
MGDKDRGIISLKGIESSLSSKSSSEQATTISRRISEQGDEQVYSWTFYPFEHVAFPYLLLEESDKHRKTAGVEIGRNRKNENYNTLGLSADIGTTIEESPLTSFEPPLHIVHTGNAGNSALSFRRLEQG